MSTPGLTPAPANPSQIPADVRIPSLASGTCGRIHPAIRLAPFSGLASPSRGRCGCGCGCGYRPARIPLPWVATCSPKS